MLVEGVTYDSNQAEVHFFSMKSARLSPSPGREFREALDWSNKACNPAFLDLARFLLLAFEHVFWDAVSWAAVEGKDALQALVVFSTLTLRREIGTGAGILTFVSLPQCPQVMALVGPGLGPPPVDPVKRDLFFLLGFISDLTWRRLPFPRSMMWPQQLQTCCLCLSDRDISCSNIKSLRRLIRYADVWGAVVASRCAASVRNLSVAVCSL